jgi:hypothetical protein
MLEMLTAVGFLFILGTLLGAVCLYVRPMLGELRRVNHHLRALRDEYRRRARAERQALRATSTATTDLLTPDGPRRSGS